MKKQILILCTLVLAFGLGNLFAQPSLTPTPLVCIDIDNPLQVVPGQAYTYSVEVPIPPATNGLEGVKTYHWYVTQDTEFINSDGLNTTGFEPFAGDFLASGDGHYNTATVDAASIELVWQSFSLDPTEYLFVVIYVTNAAPESGCITDNLKVYRITPLHSFTIDIANVNLDTNDLVPEGFEQCVPNIASAVFANDGVVYDYGSNELYFVVAAANITGSYQLSVRFDGNPLQPGTNGTTAGQVATLYQGSVWGDVIAASGGGEPLGDGDVVSFLVNNTNPIGTTGLMHYIKIVIDHNSFEATEGPYEYIIEIDGVLVDGGGNPLSTEFFGAVVDIYTNDDPPVCNGFGYDEGWKKSATQFLTRRPTILPVPDTVVFLPIVD